MSTLTAPKACPSWCTLPAESHVPELDQRWHESDVTEIHTTAAPLMVQAMSLECGGAFVELDASSGLSLTPAEARHLIAALQAALGNVEAVAL